MVTRGGELVQLSRTEWLLLQHLAANAGKVVLHTELLTKVWGPEYRDDLQYLRVWVSRVRRKLGAKPGEPGRIRTFQGIGYLLDVEGDATSPASGSIHEVDDRPACSRSAATVGTPLGARRRDAARLAPHDRRRRVPGGGRAARRHAGRLRSRGRPAGRRIGRDAIARRARSAASGPIRWAPASSRRCERNGGGDCSDGRERPRPAAQRRSARSRSGSWPARRLAMTWRPSSGRSDRRSSRCRVEDAPVGDGVRARAGSGHRRSPSRSLQARARRSSAWRSSSARLRLAAGAASAEPDHGRPTRAGRRGSERAPRCAARRDVRNGHCANALEQPALGGVA